MMLSHPGYYLIETENNTICSCDGPHSKKDRAQKALMLWRQLGFLKSYREYKIIKLVDCKTKEIL